MVYLILKRCLIPCIGTVSYTHLDVYKRQARKRAAKERTEAKNAELEKQKQEMARKQAIWEKATSVAQAE